MSVESALNSLPRFVRGVITPMFTPFDATGHIDAEGVRGMVKWLKSRRIVSTVFARCGVGKMYTYTCDEARMLIDLVTEAAQGEIGVICGTAGEFDGNPQHRPDPASYLRQTVELTKYAEAKGANAAVLPVPVALTAPPGQKLEEVIADFYARVAGETALPLFVYRMPGLPDEYEVTPDLLSRLLEIPNIIGMKYSGAEAEPFRGLMGVAKGRRFAVICGAEHGYATALPLGIAGVIGGGCNTHPELIYAVQEAFVRGDTQAMARAHEDVVKALECWKGFGGAVMGMQYIARKGGKVPPYQRSGVDPYGALEHEPYSEDEVSEAERALDAIVAPYREYLEKRWDGRVLLPGDRA